MGNIFLDVDGTLLPYGKVFKSVMLDMTAVDDKTDVEAMKKAHYERIKTDKGYDGAFNKKLYEIVDFFPGVDELITKLVNTGNTITFITSSSSGGQKKFKLKKLTDYLAILLKDKPEVLERFKMDINPEISELLELPDGIIAASAKYKHTQNGVLVDDTLKAVAEHIIKNRMLGVLVNLDGDARIDAEKLKELKDTLKELKTEKLLVEVRSIKDLEELLIFEKEAKSEKPATKREPS